MALFGLLAYLVILTVVYSVVLLEYTLHSLANPFVFCQECGKLEALKIVKRFSIFSISFRQAVKTNLSKISQHREGIEMFVVESGKYKREGGTFFCLSTFPNIKYLQTLSKYIG